MTKTWKNVFVVLLVVIAIAVGLLVQTYSVPSLRDLAKSLSDQNDLPIWIAGMLAPLVFVYRRVRDGLSKLFHFGGSAKVDSIEKSRDQIRKEVDDLLQWRRDTLKQEIDSMLAVRKEIEGLKSQLGGIQQEIERVKNRTAEQKGDLVKPEDMVQPMPGGGTFQ